MKEQKGITLVALVITIVILIILAGIAIGSLTNYNIFNRAKNARNDYKASQNNEEEFLRNADDYVENITNEK